MKKTAYIENLTSSKRMNRRTFLKSTAALGIGGLASSIPQQAWAEEQTINTAKNQTFKFKNGKFKVLQLTDTHYLTGDPRSERALKNVREMLDLEKPDLVIHTGDIIFGKPAEKSLREILGPMAERKIPFAVAMGNHDGQYDKNRREVADIIRSIPYNINVGVEGVYGDTNDIITIESEKDNSTKWVFYLFDSGDWLKEPDYEGYDYIRHDQIDWYRKNSNAFTQKNNGKPVPSLAFFHIPLMEFTYALRYDTKRFLRGNWGEDPCPPTVNSGLYAAMREQKDVMAIVCGHDHDNDFAMQWRKMIFMFGRFSGCDITYNNLKPNGARVFEFTEGVDGFRSWIREFGGVISHNHKFPDEFNKY